MNKDKDNELPKEPTVEIAVDPKLVKKAHIFSAMVGVVVFLLGAAVLIGWKFDITILKSVYSGFVAMKANTALGLSLLGAALWFLQEKRSKHWVRYLGWASAFGAILIGATAIFEYFTGWNLRIDNLFFTEAPGAVFTIYPGRMALNTAFVFVFLGIGLIFLNVKTKRNLCLSSLIALLGGSVALLVLIGYVYNISEFHLFQIFYTPMAIHTASGFLLISLGILFARPEGRLSRVFVSASSVGITVRRLLPLAFIVPLGLGTLEHFGDSLGLFNKQFGHSLLTTITMTMLVVLIWLNAMQMARKEAALARTEEEARRLALLMENTFEAMAIADYESGNLLRYVNKAWEKLFGYKKEEVVNKLEPLIIAVARQNPDLYKKFKDSISNYREFHAEMNWARKDGKLVPVEVISSPIKDVGTGKFIWFNTIRDISERKLVEEKIIQEKEISQTLAKDLEKFKLAVDGVSNHVIITDNGGKILYANKAAETITGYTQKEMLGKIPGQLWGGHMPEKFYIAMWDAIKNKKHPFMAEVNNMKKDGQEYVAEMHISPILDKNGQVQFFVGIERDITKAKELDKIRSEFVSVASHQLRTPLTAIKWYLGILLENKKLARKETKHLQQVFDSNERMIKLVGDLLSVSRIETGKKFSIMPAQIDIIKTLKEVVDEESAAHHDDKVKIKLSRAIPSELILSVDNDKMRQVLQNLIDNAVKYSTEKGVVEIDCQQTADSFIFSIKDNGVGIPKNQQHRMFEKFFRADNVSTLKNQGTGLGLYIAKAIVEGHGGKIWFESEENKGTIFYFSLPLKKQEEKAG